MNDTVSTRIGYILRNLAVLMVIISTLEFLFPAAPSPTAPSPAGEGPILVQLFTYLVIGTLGVILLMRSSYVRTVGIWKYRPNMPEIWWAGSILGRAGAIGLILYLHVAITKWIRFGNPDFDVYAALLIILFAIPTIAGIALIFRSEQALAKSTVQNSNNTTKI